MKVSNLVGSLRYSKAQSMRVETYNPREGMFGRTKCKHGVIIEGSRTKFIDGVNYCKVCEVGQ